MAKIKVSQSIRDFVGSHDDSKHSTFIPTYTDYTVEISTTYLKIFAYKDLYLNILSITSLSCKKNWCLYLIEINKVPIMK